MIKITIFTPTYNRAHLLPRVFRSLQSQSNKNFEWLIVDDGSKDNTGDVVASLKMNASFKIRYHYQDNAGKQAAQNVAIDIAAGELFLCLDSDDLLASETTIEELLNCWNEAKNNSNCVGMISLKSDLDHQILGDSIPEDVAFCTPVELRSKYHSNGERNYIVLTKIMRENKYPSFKGERFCPDSYVFDKLSHYYVMALRNSIDEICEYQSDGLSSSFKTLMKHNPLGFCISNMQIIDLYSSFDKQFSAAVHYWAFKFYTKDKTIKYEGKRKWLVYPVQPIGFLLSVYYKLYLLR